MRFAGIDSSAAKGHEVLIHTQTVGTALLGMELRPHHVATRRRRGGRLLGGRDGVAGRVGRVWVDEIEERPIGNFLPQRGNLGPGKPAPTWSSARSTERRLPTP